MKLLTFVLLIATVTAHAEVKVTPGDISDKRTTGKDMFSKSLEVELKLSGPEVAECKSMRITLTQAKDDAGNALKEQHKFGEIGFEDPHAGSMGMGSFNKDPKDTVRTKLEFENPARSAKSVTLEGTVDMLVPSKDPSATIAVDVAKAAGNSVQNAALKAGNVTLTFKSPKGSEVGYTMTDPQKKVASMEFCSASGEPLKTNGHMTSSFGGKEEVSVTLEGSAPAGMIAKVYLVTDKSLIHVPVKFAGVTLP